MFKRKEIGFKTRLLRPPVPQGSFSERLGFVVHGLNMGVLITFPAAVVLLLPSVTPGKVTFNPGGLPVVAR